MRHPDDSKPSFSIGRRWLGALNAAAASAAVLALAVMINYLAAGHFLRWNVSRDASFKLSRQTRAVLDTLTNDVKATLFFNPHGDNEQIYGLSDALLSEYQNANPRHIHVSLLDYTRSTGEAKELLARYNLSGQQDKDFVLFESNGHHKIVYARELADYDFNDLLSGRSKFVRRSAFRGELLFTSDIYAVSYPQALKAYFLYGHGENNPGSPSGEAEKLGLHGYSKLAAILKEQIDSDWDQLSLLGTNAIPHDCQLLIVAGPREGEFTAGEIDKIAAYLKNGGRLLALLTKPCGLEPLLTKQWGVRLGNSRVEDKDPRYTEAPYYFRTAELSPHPIMNPLIKDNTPLLMVIPRPVYPVEDHGNIPGTPKVTLLAATSAKAVDRENHAGVYYLLAAVEQGGIKGVDTPRGGGTRILVAGDSDFLDDHNIVAVGNTEFAYLALNWLLQRPPIQLEGLVPQPIREYKLFLTSSETSRVRWIFLGGMPASVLALGGLVWLRRRH